MSPWLYLACAWPGLPALWLRGRWSGLGWAALFTVTFDTALLATFVWPEWLSWAMTATLWIATASLWTLGFWHSLTQLPALLGTRIDPTADQKLVEAQTAYLQGQYYEAEQTLRRLLHLQPDDPEARLLLASIYRRTARKREAEGALKRLLESPRGGRWLFEATRLKAAIAEMDDEPAAKPSEPLLKAVVDPPPSAADEPPPVEEATDSDGEAFAEDVPQRRAA